MGTLSFFRPDVHRVWPPEALDRVRFSTRGKPTEMSKIAQRPELRLTDVTVRFIRPRRDPGAARLIKHGPALTIGPAVPTTIPV